LIGYLKVESVDLALEMLDGSFFRDGHKIKLEGAEFE
jgi:hypothetical protein